MVSLAAPTVPARSAKAETCVPALPASAAGLQLDDAAGLDDQPVAALVAIDLGGVYPVHVMTRKSFGLMTRKLFGDRITKVRPSQRRQENLNNAPAPRRIRKSGLGAGQGAAPLSRDYYDVLGVGRSASVADIKKAYRKLGPEIPSRPESGGQIRRGQVQGDPGGQRRPQRSQETGPIRPVRVRRRPSARRARRVPARAAGFEGFDFSDSARRRSGTSSTRSSAAGRAAARRPPARRPNAGDDLIYTMKIGFEDAVRGVQTKIKLVRDAACALLRGNGRPPSGPAPDLSDLRRDGPDSRSTAGVMRFSAPCPACEGSGKVRGEDCRDCSAAGGPSRRPSSSTSASRPASTRVPRSASRERERRAERRTARRPLHHPGRDAARLSSSGTGRRSRSRSPSRVPEATLGAKIDVPTLDGRSTIRIPPGTKSGQKFRLREAGRPIAGRPRPGATRSSRSTIVPPPFDNQRVRELMKELEKVAPQSRGRSGRSPEMRRRKAAAERRRSRTAFHISTVSRRFNIHPQTLRLYEREGLLKPSRSEGNTRLYTNEDLKRSRSSSTSSATWA